MAFSNPECLQNQKNFLPNARFISRNPSVSNDASDNLHSHILSAYGQFLAHDMTSVSISTGLLLNFN